MKKDELSQKQLHAVQYWYVDGTFELTFGGLCLLLAIYFYIQAIAPESRLSNILSMAFVLVIIGGGYLLSKLTMLLKERVTFPRTGYVSYPRAQGGKRVARLAIVMTVTAGISFFMTLIFATQAAPQTWMSGATGLLLGAVWGYLGWRTDLPRFYILAALSVLFGLGITFAMANSSLGLAAHYALMGMALWHYRRTTTPPTEAGNGE